MRSKLVTGNYAVANRSRKPKDCINSNDYQYLDKKLI